MSLELLVLVYVTFKQHSEVYFWSTIITTLGIILQTPGYILKSFENSTPDILSTIICKVGWISNVTSFSIVLWSRLHLVVNSERLMKVVLWVMIINGIHYICHTPVVVCELGLTSANRKSYYQVMRVYEKVQQSVFSAQEVSISSMYVYFTARVLNAGYTVRTRKVVALLAGVQLTVVALDILLTAINFNDMLNLRCTIHPFMYSVKLKLEFIVLDQLQQIVKKGLAPGLNLRSLTSSDQSGEPSRESEPNSLPHLEDQQELKGTDFITGTRMALPEPSPSTGRSIADETSQGELVGCEQTISTNDYEADLKDVIGNPDDEFEGAVVDDLERRYLGPTKAL